MTDKSTGIKETPQSRFTPEHIKEIRLALGETQNEFAKRIGTWTNRIGFWERGTQSPEDYRFITALLDAEHAAFGKEHR